MSDNYRKQEGAGMKLIPIVALVPQAAVDQIDPEAIDLELNMTERTGSVAWRFPGDWFQDRWG